jgi:hypothetical protein
MPATDPNKPPLRFRTLRIAWSVFWLLVLMFIPPLLVPTVEDGDFTHPDFKVLKTVDRIALISVVILVMLAWLPDHFRLRTLLIATTLFALLLGLVVYATR